MSNWNQHLEQAANLKISNMIQLFSRQNAWDNPMALLSIVHAAKCLGHPYDPIFYCYTVYSHLTLFNCPKQGSGWPEIFLGLCSKTNAVVLICIVGLDCFTYDQRSVHFAQIRGWEMKRFRPWQNVLQKQLCKFSIMIYRHCPTFKEFPIIDTASKVMSFIRIFGINKIITSQQWHFENTVYLLKMAQN